MHYAVPEVGGYVFPIRNCEWNKSLKVYHETSFHAK